MFLEGFDTPLKTERAPEIALLAPPADPRYKVSVGRLPLLLLFFVFVFGLFGFVIFFIFLA